MISDLKFFQDREALAGPDGFQLGVRRQDRTTLVIQKYLALSASLPQARQNSLSFCEAAEGKGGIISLRVVDRPGFEALQAQIKAQSEELVGLETAIQALDKLAGNGELWYSDIESMVGSYARTEHGENTRLANLASAVLSRKMNSGKPHEQILAEDDEYVRLSGIAKEQVDNANKQLAIMRPKLEELKAILEGVGC